MRVTFFDLEDTENPLNGESGLTIEQLLLEFERARIGQPHFVELLGENGFDQAFVGHLQPVFFRCEVNLLLKKLGKVVWVFKAKFIGNFCIVQITSLFKHFFCFPDHELVNTFER